MALCHKKVGDPWHELTSTILSLFYHRFARNLVRYVGVPHVMELSNDGFPE